MANKLKILLLGDYSNCHANLSIALKKLGHEVTLMAPVNYLSSNEVNIDTCRKDGKLGGAVLYLKTLTSWKKSMKNYDVVAINDPNFLSLKPRRLKVIFDRLNKENESIFYTAMSNDINYLNMCEDSKSLLKFNEYFINGYPSPWNLEDPERWRGWHDPRLINYQNYVFNNIKGAVSILYEYHIGLRYRFEESKIAYGGIPIDTSEIPFIGPNLNNKVKILLCRDRNRIKLKGVDLLEKAITKIAEKYPQIVNVSIAENLPYRIFIEELKKSDIILDQVYSYTPATTALIAMAMGKTVVSGGEPEFYEFIGEKENHPIINATFDVKKLYDSIEKVVLDKNFISENALKSREFVEKHNNSVIVAERFVNLWTRNILNEQ